MAIDDKINELSSFKNPTELIKSLNSWSDLIEFLYQNRNAVDFSLENLENHRPNTDSQRAIEKMVKYDIISIDDVDKTVGLNATILQFLESYCGNYGSVKTGVLDDHYNALSEALANCREYLKENDKHHLKDSLSKVIKSFKHSTAYLNKILKDCSRVIDVEIVKSDKSFNIKKNEIENLRKCISDITAFLKKMDKLVNEIHKDTIDQLRRWAEYSHILDSAFHLLNFLYRPISKIY